MKVNTQSLKECG